MPNPSHGFEFQASLIQYARHGSKQWVPSTRTSIGSISVPYEELAAYSQYDEEVRKGLPQRLLGAVELLLGQAALQMMQSPMEKPLSPSSDEEVTSSQLHDLANKMEQGQIRAKVLSIRTPNGYQELTFILEPNQPFSEESHAR